MVQLKGHGHNVQLHEIRVLDKKFPTPCKSSIIFPLIKKQGLDPEILKNYRPVANPSFISKIIEKAIATQIHDHLINNDSVDNFQSAYKAGHICETALCIMILLLLLLEVMVLCLFYLIYRQLLMQLIMIIFFVFLRNM